MSAPWYTFPRIDNFGQVDPQGKFWKPDSNIQLPGYYPITALNSGVVTSVQNSSFGGQTVVTIKLDQPLNSLATHEFYEHMSSSTVSVGSVVNAGQVIGYNNPPGAVPLGFGLYPGDVYGQGPSWLQDQADLAPWGANLLNPVSLLNAASSSAGGQVSGQSVVLSGSTLAFPSVPDAVGGFVQRAGVLVLGLVIVIGGVYVIFHQQIDSVVRGALKTGEEGALV